MKPSMRWHLALALALSLSAGLKAQTPSPDYLGNGIARVRAGEFQLGVMMLNEVVAPWSKADPATVARAHVYRAQAFLGLNQPENARAAALLALKADPRISVTPANYSADVVRLFEEARRPARAIPPEVAAAVAEQTGNHKDAFAAYVAAYQALPEPVPADADRRLREKIITLAQRLDPPPAIPQDARAHYAKAEQLVEAQTVLGGGGTTSLEAAARELQAAVRAAPWWGDAAWKLATVLQQLQRVDAALLNLNLYRLADPGGSARATAGTAAAAGASPVRETVPAPARTASVYIYWPPQTREKGAPKVYCDGFLVAELRKGRFIALSVPGGTHTIKLNDAATFTFEPGRSYYLRASIEGFHRWAPLTVRLVDPAEAEAEIRQKSVAPNDASRTYTHQCAAPPAGRK
jgi:hypothetical protein